MDGISKGIQNYRRQKSEMFREQLLSTVFGAANGSTAVAEVELGPTAALSVRDRIMQDKAARFQARLDNN